MVGPEDQLIFTGSKDGRIFHVYDSSGILLRSFGEPLTPLVPPKSRFEEMFIPNTICYSKGFLFATHPFRYEILKFDFASGKLISTFELRFPQWREAEFLEGGIQFYTGSGSTVVLDDGRILNVIAECNVGLACKNYIDLVDKDGKTMTDPQLVNYDAISIDRNGKLYLASKDLSWRVVRCTLTR